MPDYSELVRATHAADLGLAMPALEAAGYAVDLRPDDPQTLPELVLGREPDEEGRPRTINLVFIPVDDDDVEHTKFLQVYAPLPYRAPAERLADVRQAAAIVNEHVVLGNFSVTDQGELRFRYVMALGKQDLLDGDVVAEVVAFVDFQQEHMGDYLEGVCVGEVSVAVLPQVIAQAE